MTRSITFRLNLWYAVTFLLSVGALFVALYFLVAAAAQRQDREIVEARLKELTAVYNGGGATALRSWVERGEGARREKLFIRAVNRWNETAFLSAPEEWVNYEPPRFNFGIARPLATIRVPRDTQRDFTIAATVLRDGAVKYTNDGGRIDIRSRCDREAVVVTIRDTGIGIPADELPKIWDRLYRGDRSRSQRGLGLGLSLVKAFVEAHNGRIEVRSEPGAFSEFMVRLPAPHA